MLNRSIICKVANNLRKGGYTLSQAFRMAWKLAKGKASVGSGKAYKMGYISAAVACLLSGIIDNITTVNARLQAITGGFYADMVQGLRLSLSI